MTREENLQYRRMCPYDCMGDFGGLITEDNKSVSNAAEVPKDEPEKTE